MTYAGMQVADGQEAGIAWESLVRGSLDQSERERTRKPLLDYREHDRLAMVKLIEQLRFRQGRPVDASRKHDATLQRCPLEHAYQLSEQATA
jgi:hypothetical protein